MEKTHMILRRGSLFVGIALTLVLISSQAQAHWCDDLWASSYNIVVKPASDTVTAGSPMSIYVQNNMGYQLINFVLTASVGGKAITSTPPTTLKVANTLLPGEKGTWKISGTGLTKIEDVTFSVSFGNAGENKCYPSKGANAVMVVKSDGTLYPATPAGLDAVVNPGCSGGSEAQGRSLQYSAMADFENVGTGLDKLMTLYCSGRASWGSSDGVTPSMCPSPTTNPAACPATTPASGTGSKFDYVHLWAAGELAARKSVLGARTAILRFRLRCGANDADVGFAGYAMVMLGYLGQDTTAQAFLTTQSAAAGDLGTIAKASLYLMGDTTQKAAVQTGAQSSSVFVKAACAAALGIVDKDDATVTSALIPQVQWTEPDTGNDGKAMFAAHLLELVAWDRRGWAANGADTGAASFYGNVATGNGGNGGGTGGAVGTGGTSGTGGVATSGGVTGAGGTTGAGGATGKQDASPGTDARTGSGGSTPGSGGAPGNGGSTTGAGGSTVPGAGGSATPNAGGSTAPNAGGKTGTTQAGGSTSSAGGDALGGTTSSNGGSVGAGGDTGTVSPPASADSTGCKCNIGGHAQATPTMGILFMAGLAWIAGRRRRR
jgi:MYXO-CTERM domain-containing protein